MPIIIMGVQNSITIIILIMDIKDAIIVIIRIIHMISVNKLNANLIYTYSYIYSLETISIGISIEINSTVNQCNNTEDKEKNKNVPKIFVELCLLILLSYFKMLPVVHLGWLNLNWSIQKGYLEIVSALAAVLAALSYLRW